MKLTLPQQDIFFEQLIFPNEPIYNIGAKIKIKGSLNIEIFRKAYIELINQHDAFRSILLKHEGNTSIKILEDHQSELGFIDFSKSYNPVEEAIIYMQREFIKPFNLFKENLLHVFTLVKVNDDYHFLFSVYHHIITDGWGTSLMYQRLVQNYNEILEFGEVKSKYPFSYKDFVEDDYIYQNSESFTQDLNYWSQKFKVLPENLLEELNDKIQINKSSRKELIIKRDVYNQLTELAKNYKCSSFHLILGILFTYFGRKHQNTDFSIGLPVLNRSKSKFKKTVGLFMGISPLRIGLDFEETFDNLIKDIKKQLRQDYRHQRFPLGKLIQELQLTSEKNRLFNIILSYEKQNYAINFQHTQTRVIPLTHQSERVALAIYIRENDEMDDVKIDFDYNLNYFDDIKISDVIQHFVNLIKGILAYPDKKLKELSYLTELEKRQILVDFNDTKAEYPKDKTIIDLFEAQVEKNPNKEALKDDYNSYSYSQLSKLSNQIGEYLTATYGENDKSPIAILLSRSASLIAVLFGILKSGRSYIPLDPILPQERLNYIFDNSKSKILISENGYELVGVEDITVISLEDIFLGIDEFKGNINTIISPNDTAYIIYTSGSTGNPKGVELGHQSLLNFLCSVQQKPGVNSNDTLFSVTTYSFDISILEFFLPLISGATLYVANQDTLSDPYLIIKKLEEIKPTIIQATPSFYQMLFNADWGGDKELRVLCGGDLLSEALAEKLLNTSSEVWNMYGPTETTIWSSVKKIVHFKDASNIGKPINNTQFYILDDFLSPKPIGTSGAIYISGDGLAKGYYKNKLLTKKKFIKNPFDAGSLLYETGDVGKWNSKGEIEFFGRNDNQVKIRGYRIELGDIESQLNQIPGIQDSVVIAKKGDEQHAILFAYILKRGDIPCTEKIIATLKRNLPYYMIPNKIFPIKEFPLTPNQKVDRKSLSQRSNLQNINYDDFKAPFTDLEKKLSEYWASVLNSKETISVNANFFALGGHSLNAIKLIGLITKELSFDISLKIIFDYPTIELLAKYLKKLIPNQSISIPLSESKVFYNLTQSQYNIWLISQQKNGSIAYNMSAGYTVEGMMNLDKITKSINKIISKYEILRTNFIEIEGIPYQRINSFENVKFEINIHKLGDEEAAETICQLNDRAFDLETDILVRVQLLQVKKKQFILLFCTHHIIMDGLSLEIFIKEFIENYNQKNSLNAPKENALTFQYRDYSEWFNKTLEENAIKDKLFWENYLKHYQPKDSFERDFRIKDDPLRGDKYIFELPPNTTLSLHQLAVEEKVTFYTILMTALNVLICKFSNHNDICIGTVNSGRNSHELNNQIGMFVKTLVLRTKIVPEQNFVDILKNTQNNLLQINNFQDIPLEMMSLSIFDVLLVYQNPEFSFDDINGINDFNLTTYPIYNKYSRIPIVFNLFESDNRLKGIIEYNCNLFEEDTIKILSLKYCKILNEIIDNPLMKVALIDDKLGFEKNTSFDFDFNF